MTSCNFFYYSKLGVILLDLLQHPTYYEHATSNVRRDEVMKKLVLIILIVLAVATHLTGATIGEPVVLYLHAYIPERTTFHANEFGVLVESNVNNFTYSVAGEGIDRLVMVVAR
jgi:hypothetical protein